mmetsp:Transcript_106905/g.319644  ORF Transcript_106905/g.319644 Transcript_106905/m.319644 type:complete len:297 (-) Transcript_106905:69-959(-)
MRSSRSCRRRLIHAASAEDSSSTRTASATRSSGGNWNALSSSSKPAANRMSDPPGNPSTSSVNFCENLEGRRNMESAGAELALRRTRRSVQKQASCLSQSHPRICSSARTRSSRSKGASGSPAAPAAPATLLSPGAAPGAWTSSAESTALQSRASAPSPGTTSSAVKRSRNSGQLSLASAQRAVKRPGVPGRATLTQNSTDMPGCACGTCTGASPTCSPGDACSRRTTASSGQGSGPTLARHHCKTLSSPGAASKLPVRPSIGEANTLHRSLRGGLGKTWRRNSGPKSRSSGVVSA